MKQRTTRSERHQFCIDLIGSEDLIPLFLLRLLSHAGPDVGIDDVGVAHGDSWIGCLFDFRVWVSVRKESRNAASS